MSIFHNLNFYHEKIRALDYGDILQERIYATLEEEIKLMIFRSIKDGGNPVVADWEGTFSEEDDFALCDYHSDHANFD
jgi:hypothetical protein